MAAGGIAGPLNGDKTEVLGGPNIQDWWGKPLRKRLQDAVRAPVFLENDAAMGGLGEAVYGTGIGYDIVAYITVSTGLGGSRIVKRRIDISAQGFEPGKMIIDAGNTLVPGASDFGVLEDYVSGAGIKKKHRREAYEIESQHFWDEKTELLAYGLHNVSVLWSPDVIILGGPLLKQPGINLDLLRERLALTLTIFDHPPALELAKHGDLVGLYGGLAYANNRAIG
jgi:predicted NBD/HSP70 family sugar kinase